MDWLTLFFIIGFIIYTTINGPKKSKQQPTNKTMYFIKNGVLPLFLIAFLLILNPNLSLPIDFSIIEKGYLFDNDSLFYTLCFSIPTTTFLLAFTRWTNLYPPNIQEETKMFGYPLTHYPDDHSQLFFFSISLVIGVIFEELLCRQFLFYLLHSTIGLKGDFLLIMATFLFSIGHLYQGKEGLISSFIFGLFLGKLFMLQESIIAPISVHLLFNLTILPLAFRRIQELNKIME